MCVWLYTYGMCVRLWSVYTILLNHETVDNLILGPSYSKGTDVVSVWLLTCAPLTHTAEHQLILSAFITGSIQA